jgi:hypothetical protein
MSYTESLMSEKQRILLFFIASPQYKLTAVENFLKKRDYDVFVETDIKAGLLHLIEVQPDFVFIALDHPHPNINVLPQIIEQCVTTNIIPFTHSSTKADIKKLDESTYINKILPPLSGPAVERMAIKLRSQAGSAEKKTQHAKNLDSVVNSFLEQLSERQKHQKVETKIDVKGHSAKLKEKNSFFAKSKKNSITSKQKESLQKNFQKQIKADLADILETCQHDNPSTNVLPLKKDLKTVYCLLVQSKDWSGHLMAYSNTNLERHLLEPVVKNWVSKEFQYFNENESHIFFEIEINLQDFKVWANNKSEYIETLKVNDSELLLSFVGIEPKNLLMEFDEAHDLIDLKLSWVPMKKDLELNLFLHLPENKKYLLYTPKGQQLNDMQRTRLVENHVEILHSPVEFEDEVKKLKMIHYFEHLFKEAESASE